MSTVRYSPGTASRVWWNSRRRPESDGRTATWSPSLVAAASRHLARPLPSVQTPLNSSGPIRSRIVHANVHGGGRLISINQCKQTGYAPAVVFGADTTTREWRFLGHYGWTGARSSFIPRPNGQAPARISFDFQGWIRDRGGRVRGLHRHAAHRRSRARDPGLGHRRP